MKIVVLIVATIFSLQAFSWGPTGHRAVAEVANKFAKTKTIKAIKKLLDGHSLARVSIWADKIKSDPENYSHTYNWHYTDWPDKKDKYDSKKNSGTLVTSIDDNLKVLSNKKASKAERVFALKFLVHLVGDLHQPFHIGNGFDRGGNYCKVMFHKQKVSLHKLWDTTLIEFTKLSYNEFSDYVSVSTPEEIKEFKKGNVLDWAKESKEIRIKAYPKDLISGFSGDKSNKLKYCQKDSKLSNEQLPQLGYQYSYKFMPILERRVFKAGLRLAALLDSAL